MHPLSSRPYAGPADLQSMISLTQELRGCGQTVYPIATDLYEELADPDTQSSACLWEHNHRLVGFAYVSRYLNLVNVFTESLLTPAIEAEMIARAEAAVKRRNQEEGQVNTLDASALENDLPRLAFLERHGFECQEESSILLGRSLNQPIPVPVLPPGFIIRPLTGEMELEAYVALHRAAFGTDNMTVEYRRTIMGAPGFIPELDLVAVAPDGSLAAFCVCQIFPDDAPRAGGNKEGWTDPLGTHPAHQQRGLAKALILTGMLLLKERGMDTALLGTSSTNLAMLHTAEAVGFRRKSNTLWFCKQV